MDDEKIGQLIAELGKLNENFRLFHDDSKRLVGSLKTMAELLKAMGPLSRQIATLNQIMLQVGRTAGTSGMIEQLIKSVLMMARSAK